MAFPSVQEGFVQVVDLSAMKTKVASSNIFKAHSHAIACIAFSTTGKLVATASSHGTLIRVFDLKGTKAHEFRRSLTSSASILSLSFSLQNTALAVASSTGTLHVFFLDNPEQGSFPIWTGPTREITFSIPESKLAVCAFIPPQAMAPASQISLQLVCDDCTFRVFRIQGDRRIAKPDAEVFYRFYKSSNSLLTMFLKDVVEADQDQDEEESQPRES